MDVGTSLIIVGFSLICFGVYWQWKLYHTKDFLQRWEQMLNKKEQELLEKYSDTTTGAHDER